LSAGDRSRRSLHRQNFPYAVESQWLELPAREVLGAIADNLNKAGWSWGCVSAIDSNGRTIWIADAHRDGKRFVVRADEKLMAFLELESAVVPFSASSSL
jgi:hypothetical protein